MTDIVLDKLTALEERAKETGQTGILNIITTIRKATVDELAGLIEEFDKAELTNVADMAREVEKARRFVKAAIPEEGKSRAIKRIAPVFNILKSRAETEASFPPLNMSIGLDIDAADLVCMLLGCGKEIQSFLSEADMNLPIDPAAIRSRQMLIRGDEYGTIKKPRLVEVNADGDVTVGTVLAYADKYQNIVRSCFRSTAVSLVCQILPGIAAQYSWKDIQEQIANKPGLKNAMLVNNASYVGVPAQPRATGTRPDDPWLQLLLQKTGTSPVVSCMFGSNKSEKKERTAATGGI